MFMHASWSHLLGNMWFLGVFGKNVEDAFGRARYLAMYVAGGFAAAAAQTAVTLIAGSAADAGADARRQRRHRRGARRLLGAVSRRPHPDARVRVPVRIRAWVFLGLWFLYQLIEAHYGLTAARSTVVPRSSPTSAASSSA